MYKGSFGALSLPGTQFCPRELSYTYKCNVCFCHITNSGVRDFTKIPCTYDQLSTSSFQELVHVKSQEHAHLYPRELTYYSSNAKHCNHLWYWWVLTKSLYACEENICFRPIENSAAYEILPRTFTGMIIQMRAKATFVVVITRTLTYELLPRAYKCTVSWLVHVPFFLPRTPPPLTSSYWDLVYVKRQRLSVAPNRKHRTHYPALVNHSNRVVNHDVFKYTKFVILLWFLSTNLIPIFFVKILVLWYYLDLSINFILQVS